MILLIVPSRNRPESAKRCYECWKRNSTWRSRVVLMVDDDDPNTYVHPPWLTDRRPRLNLVQKLNAAAKDHQGDCAVIGFIGDDVTIETPEWDRLILEKMAKMHPCSILFPNDGIGKGRNLPNHVFMSVEAYRRLGWFAYPPLHHCWIDHVWRELGKRLGRVNGYHHAKDIIMRHRHCMYDPEVPVDATHQEIYQSAAPVHDKAAFRVYCAGGIQADVERLLA